jgi:hypothetical protein
LPHLARRGERRTPSTGWRGNHFEGLRFEGGVLSDYDLDSLNRFIDSVLFNRPSDDFGVLEHYRIIRESRGIPEKTVTPDEIAAAFALRDALTGVNLPQQLGYSLKSPTEAQKRETIHHPAFAVVMAALNNEFPGNGTGQRQYAVSEIAKIFNFGSRSAESYYDDVKISAASTLESLKKVYAVAGFGEFKALEFEQKTLEQEIRDMPTGSINTRKNIERVMELKGLSYPEAQAIYHKVKRSTTK